MVSCCTRGWTFAAALLLSATTSCAIVQGVQPPVASFTCLDQQEPQVIAAGETILLHLKHPLYRYLHPNQRCEMHIQFKGAGPAASAPHRWLVSVVNASLEGYSASAQFNDSVGASPAAAARLKVPLTSETPHLDNYQFITSGDDFRVVFTTNKLPETPYSTGLVLQATPFTRCPKGWFDSGISCYSLPLYPEVALLSYADSKAVCSRLGDGQLIQGVYINDRITESIQSLLSLRSMEGGASRLTANASLHNRYWVGIVRREARKNFSYANGFSTPHPVKLLDGCAASNATCDCAVYDSSVNLYLAEHCSVGHRYICAMPLNSAAYCRSESANRENIVVGVSPVWRSVSIALIVIKCLIGVTLTCRCFCYCCKGSAPARI